MDGNSSRFHSMRNLQHSLWDGGSKNKIRLLVESVLQQQQQNTNCLTHSMDLHGLDMRTRTVQSVEAVCVQFASNGILSFYKTETHLHHRGGLPPSLEAI